MKIKRSLILNSNGPRQKYEVNSVRKALEVLCAFTPETPSWSVSELARCLHLPKSTTHNLLRTLHALDFVRQRSTDREYYLGPKVYELGLVFSDSSNLISRALPHLRELAEQTQETVKLAELSDGQVLVVAAVESKQQLHTRGDVGRRWPVHSSSLGKAMLSCLPPAEVRTIVERCGLPRFSERTITTLEQFEKTLEKIHHRGYALDWEENEVGVRCIGASIYDPLRQTVASISVSSPSVRLNEAMIPDLAASVVRTARAISDSLGE